MYEIRIDEADGRVIARAQTPDGALRQLDRIADETAAQLQANGEGGNEFLLELLVWDTERAAIVAKAGIRG
ncbi:MAG: hypothetical protein ACT4QF_01530 [Sporichthyaceae bacterium]